MFATDSVFKLICLMLNSIGGLAPQTPQQGNNCFPTTLRNRFALSCLHLAGYSNVALSSEIDPVAGRI